MAPLQVCLKQLLKYSVVTLEILQRTLLGVFLIRYSSSAPLALVQIIFAVFADFAIGLPEEHPEPSYTGSFSRPASNARTP